MPRVFVGLGGGLGNQMFQAAFGIAVERRFGADVRFLANRAGADPFGRRYLLDSFAFVDVRVVGPEAAGGAPNYGETGVNGETLAALLKEQPCVVMQGYWQNERFFFGEDAAIAAAFRIEPAAALARRVEAAGAGRSIGVHVRRSEYGHHGLATADYYRDSIAAVRSEVGPAPVLCFTDEPNFARFVFQSVGDVSVVEPARDDPLNDFFALSRCRHFVIANSSFSWWAAWLGEREGSLVYAPSPWCVFDAALDPAPARWRKVEGAVRGP
jgi:hypothetical protein